MNVFRNGLAVGLVLQLAIGPVLFFVINLTLQKSLFDGLAGVLAVTIVDYLYISLAVLGVGKLLERKKIKKVFGIVSSLVLMLFGLFIIKGITDGGNATSLVYDSSNLAASFTAVFLLTISSPLTIVSFTAIFTAKAVEYNYSKKELVVFGLGTGLATLIFMGTAVIISSLVSGAIPLPLVQILNLLVGCLLIAYGATRLLKVLKVGRR